PRIRPTRRRCANGCWGFAVAASGRERSDVAGGSAERETTIRFRPMRHPIRRFSFLVVLAATAVACGGASSGAAASPESAATPGARCLAEAEAKHPQKGAQPDRITVKHVLVRYQGARNAPPAVTRSREQACLRAEKMLTKLQGGTPFADVVAAYSDESGTATREGS